MPGDYTIRIDRMGGLHVIDEHGSFVGFGIYLPGSFQSILDGLSRIAACGFSEAGLA